VKRTFWKRNAIEEWYSLFKAKGKAFLEALPLPFFTGKCEEMEYSVGCYL